MTHAISVPSIFTEPLVPHRILTSDDELRSLCAELADAPAIAFDTEFVSEHTYRPELCLLQIATPNRLVAVDTLAVTELTPFWDLLVNSQRETIVHAGREEICFCLEAVGRPPARLFDVQLAAGLAGFEYPAGYGTLIHRLLGKTLHKRETRTDWRRRPLSAHQIEYALDDVRDLESIRDLLHAELARLGRLEWLAVETKSWLEELDLARERERWRRVSGCSGLSARDLAIVRELWRWRETEAQRRNLPSRRILRDDLLVELAKRRAADEKQIRAVRGLERGDLQRMLPGISEAISKALALPPSELPPAIRRDSNQHLATVGQFLSSALASICRSARVAPNLVCNTQDVRDLVSYRLSEEANGDPPLLAQGWRAEVVGQLFDELLRGKRAIRIRDPLSDDPLTFDLVD
jgi:ribonuclease D